MWTDLRTMPVERDRLNCSVVVPCRNEARFISQCLDSIFANDYAVARYEVIVADGNSEDGTRAVLEEYATKHANFRVIDNPRRTTAAALNLAIGESRGDVVLRVDAHSTIDPSYISRCVHSLETTGADNVGGIMYTHPASDGAWSRAIVSALSHRFGVGNSAFRIHCDEPRWVDTVFGGCYRREVFTRIGLFNERLLRSQDMEFNRRLVHAGGRILLVPSIVSHYYARTDIWSFCRHNWSNGVWAILPFLHSHVMPVRWRHLVPLVFVGSILALGVAGLNWTPALTIALAILSTYALGSVLASANIAVRHRSFELLFLMPIVFGLLHILYGLGSLWAVLRLVFSAAGWRRITRAPLVMSARP